MDQQITHPEMVKLLAKDGQEIKDALTPRKAHLLHMALGIASEAGELADAIKKHTIYGQELDIENVLEELGDLEFYLEGLRQGVPLSREEALEGNIEKLSVRYKDFQYSDKAAKERADKQEA